MLHASKLIIGLSLFISSFALATTAPDKPTQKTGTPALQQKVKAKASKNPTVILQTSLGEMTVELFQDKAPESTKNFLRYVDKGFYNGIIFHRIIPNFMVQTGGFNKEYRKKSSSAPIVNESNNMIKNLRGTLSMARTNSPNSATSQFFINLSDNSSLDFTPGLMGMPDRQGYAVFGKVIKGIEAIDKMAAEPQGKNRTRGHGQFVNAPDKMITIDKAFRAEPAQHSEKLTK